MKYVVRVSLISMHWRGTTTGIIILSLSNAGNMFISDGHQITFAFRWCERNYQNQSNCNAHERKSHKLEYQATLTKGNRRIQVEGSKDKYIAIPQPEPQQS